MGDTLAQYRASIGGFYPKTPKPPTNQGRESERKEEDPKSKKDHV